MANTTEILEKINKEYEKIATNKNNVYFFVMDTKGSPNGSLTYIYTTAYKLKELGYNVHMLHVEKEFVGVGEWLGEKYANLPHHNIEKENVEISPADFLIIPEVCNSILIKTKELPCKRILLLQNVNYLTETMPPGVTLNDLKIRDCIVTTQSIKSYLEEHFPYVRTHIVPPCINDEFFVKPTDGYKKEMIINIIGRGNTNDTNTIIKSFFWKYPNYKWISFRNIEGIPHDKLKGIFDETPITIWADQTTDFGYLALEAMACENIVIGKVPDNTSDWVLKNGVPQDNALWFYDARNISDMLVSVINTYLHSGIEKEIYKNMSDTVSEYTEEKQNKAIKEVYVNTFFKERMDDIKKTADIITKQNETSENNG